MVNNSISVSNKECQAAVTLICATLKNKDELFGQAAVLKMLIELSQHVIAILDRDVSTEGKAILAAARYVFDPFLSKARDFLDIHLPRQHVFPTTADLENLKLLLEFGFIASEMPNKKDYFDFLCLVVRLRDVTMRLTQDANTSPYFEDAKLALEPLYRQIKNVTNL